VYVALNFSTFANLQVKKHVLKNYVNNALLTALGQSALL